MGKIRQALFSFAACYVCLSMGLMYAWPSSTLKLFTSANTTLHRPMNEPELALFGSLSSVGAVISTPIAGYLMDVIGRKNCTLAGCLMQVLCWALMIASHRVEVVLISIFLSGAGGTSFLVVPVYVGEFCEESIRGALTSLSVVFYASGMLLSYLFGGFLQYDIMNYSCLSIAVIGVLLISILKESPMFLMKTGKEEEAIKAISFFRGIGRDSKEMMQELDNIRRALNPNMDGEADTPEEEKLKPQILGKPKEKLSKWQFIKKSRSTRRAMMVILVLVFLSITQGLVVLQVFAEPLFEELVPSMPPTLACVLLAVMTVIAGFIAAYLVDTVGRRNLMIYASIAAGTCNIVVSSHMLSHWAPDWFIATVVYAFCISSSAGAGTVPFVVLAEAFLPEVRSIMSMLMMEWAWLCNFVILFIFNPMASAIGLGTVFLMFSCISFITAVYCYFYLPETMDLTVDAIQLLFLKGGNRSDRRS